MKFFAKAALSVLAVVAITDIAIVLIATNL